ERHEGRCQDAKRSVHDQDSGARILGGRLRAVKSRSLTPPRFRCYKRSVRVAQRRTVSLVAERAVRYLAGRPEPVGSVEVARQVLATRAPDEATARRVLEAAFASDPRLYY